MLSDKKLLKGRVNIFLRDARTGNIINEQHINNVVVDVGEDWVATRMGTGTVADMKWVELGKDITAPVGTDILLGSPIATTKNIGTNSVSGATWQLVVNWATSEANTSGIEEAGVFNLAADNSGTMLARTVFTAITKTNNDTLQIQWQIKVSDV